MLVSTKTRDLFNEIVDGMPVPCTPGAVCSLIAQAIPASAFIDNEFWAERADVPFEDPFVKLAETYATAVGITPELMVHELLNLFKGMVGTRMFLYKPETDEFLVARQFTETGDIEYEVIEGADDGSF